MSVSSYLAQRASDAVLSGIEKDSISKSITTLQSRINTWFGSDVTEHFQFGSSTRGTILPRSMDYKSDIDYMVVFKNEEDYTPQTYLNKLKRFVEYYYRQSEIYQSSPTIVLDLNHIKFELVPAKHEWWSYHIPDGSGNWMTTSPNDFNETLTEKNKNHSFLIKPTIRLAKYWNAKNSYVYGSYLFEQWIVDRTFFIYPENQKTCLFHVFDSLEPYNEDTQWRRDKIRRAKDIIEQVRDYEERDMPVSAEIEVKKLIPE